VIGALLSRCRVVVLDPLTSQDVATLVRRALEDVELGLGGSRVTISQEAVETISQLSSGDARRALNLLELCVADLEPGSELVATAVAAASQRKVLLYDKAGEEHFNLISALHKSLRESDADASLYWLYRMLEAGEDPRYLARRMVRFASEDIGLADPGALRQSLDAWEAFDRLGPPEGLLALAQAAIYLALAPKSIGVYQASKEALRSIAENPAEGVPLEIRNAPTRLMKEVGYGDGYVYAPDTEEGVGGLECLPENLRGSRFYQPRDSGWEKELRQRILELEEKRGRARD
jgi:putative ATPase